MKKIKKIISILFICLLLALSLRIVWFFAALNLRMDFSQNYRKIDGYEKIVFVEGDVAFKRSFWGLRKCDIDLTQFDEEGSMKETEAYRTVKSIVGDNIYISQCVESPDGNMILYSEAHPWGEGAPTDDEDHYYKVLDTRDMSIITIYKCPMKGYKLYWQ
ncbi:MAG: hypothetical protein K6G84_14575 [Lachnospiraceae bacterium]|nr:hypothetical protein [Lachnospiraceae bacterium]